MVSEIMYACSRLAHNELGFYDAYTLKLSPTSLFIAHNRGSIVDHGLCSSFVLMTTYMCLGTTIFLRSHIFHLPKINSHLKRTRLQDIEAIQENPTKQQFTIAIKEKERKSSRKASIIGNVA